MNPGRNDNEFSRLRNSTGPLRVHIMEMEFIYVELDCVSQTTYSNAHHSGLLYFTYTASIRLLQGI
jgi:hypothetical protein